MHRLTIADMIWNRACGDAPVRSFPGDRALTDMLRAHGLIMNGGVLHAIECLTASEMRDAEAGYCFYGFDTVPPLLSRVKGIFEADNDLGENEWQLDAQYADIIPSDSSLIERFEQRLKLKTSEFASLRPRDMT